MAARSAPNYEAALITLMEALSAAFAELEERLRNEVRPELALVEDEEGEAHE